MTTNPTSTKTPSTETSVDDTRTALFAAFEAAAPVLEAAEHADPTLPTPCPDYTVGDLLAHLNSVGNRIAAMGHGRPANEVPDTPAPADGRYADAWGPHRADVEATWAPLPADAEIVVPWRTMTVLEAASIYAAEVVVHTWDIAVATGTPFTVDDAVAEVCIAALATELPPEARSDIYDEVKQQLPDDFPWSDPFGAAVETPEGASTLDRLVAISGRSPGWPHG